MSDGVEALEGLRVLEDDAGQTAAVNAAVGGQDLGPEGGDDLLVGGAARGVDLVADLVSVQDHRPQLPQHLRYCALARAQATCQADDEHPSGPSLMR